MKIVLGSSASLDVRTIDSLFEVHIKKKKKKNIKGIEFKQ